jgi:hypothetical protein
VKLTRLFRARQDGGDSESVEVQATFIRSIQGQKGRVWEAVLIAPGVSKSKPKFNWRPKVLRAAAEAKVFEGADINAYQVADGYFGHVGAGMEDIKNRLIQDKAGVVKNVRFEEGEGLVGVIEFSARHAWIPAQLQQNPDFLGLSIDARVTAADDREPINVTRIVEASSVDIVTRPAAGGKFVRAVAARQEEIVNREQIIAMLKKQRPDLIAGKDVAQMSDDDLTVLVQQAMTAPVSEKPENGGGGESDPPPEAARQGITPEDFRKEMDAMKREMAWEKTVDARMADSRLPDHIQAGLRDRFAGRVGDDEALTAAIKKEREFLASMSVPGFDDLPDQGRAQVGPDMLRKIQMGLDMAFGLTADDYEAARKMRRLNGRPVFEDLRAAQADDWDHALPITLGELYAMLSGDPEVTGAFNRDRLPAELRAMQDISSSTFSYLLGNTLNRRMIKDYRANDFKENLLISMRKSVKDFRAQEAVNVGYFPDLATVDPETGDYQEIAGVTDEESTYTVGQKGNIMTVSRKTIINDDLSVIQRLVARLGRAARRTHSKYVWAFFEDNDTCSDGTAWFTGGHSNLGSSALAIATAWTALLALATFTEKDSGEKIGLLDDPSVMPVLVYPWALTSTAETIVKDEFYYSSNDLTDKTRNPLYGKIRGEAVSLLSDANDWGLLLPPSVVDMVEMGYLNGREEPEFFLANQPTVGQMFLADKVQYKIRHEYAGAVIDFRSAYKAEVA